MKPEDQFTMGHNVLNQLDTLLVEAGYAQDSSARHNLKIAKSIFREAEKCLSEALEWECGQGDKLCEAAGVQRTEGGSLNPAKIINALRGAPPSSEAVQSPGAIDRRDGFGMCAAPSAVNDTGAIDEIGLLRGEPMATLQAAINMTDGTLQKMLRHVYEHVGSKGKLPAAYYPKCPVCEAPQSETSASDVERLKDVVRESCYRQGEAPGFTHIYYCQWCHYARGRPHDKDCIMQIATAPSPSGVEEGDKP